MTSHYRNRWTFAGQTESPSRKCMGRRKSAFFDSAFPCELGVPFGVSSLARHSLPYPSQSALAGQRIRFRPNGMAVRGSSVLGLTGMRLFVRVGGVERAETVTHRQPATANATGHRTSIPFGYHAISKTLALADSLALSEPPDNCRPNGISVSQVYGDTEERISDSAFSCELGVPFGVSSLASHRLPHPFLPALAGQRIRFRPNGIAVRGSLVLWLTIVRLFVREGVVERAVAVTQQQPTRANVTGHRTSIPFGHHAIPETLATADSLALSEPPDVCRPNGISVSQVYGVT